MNQVELSKVIGIQDIKEDCIIRGDGSITIGYSVLLPPIFEQNSEMVWELNKGFRNILNILPPYATWHSQDYIYLKEFDSSSTKSFVDKENTKYFNGRNILNHSLFVFITFPNRYFVKKYVNNIPVITKSDWLKKKPFQKIEKVIDQARRNRDKIEKSLNSIDRIRARKLENEDLFAILKNYYALSYPDDEFQRDGNLSVPGIYRDEQNLMVGSQYARVYTMSKEPEKLYNHKNQKGISPDSFSTGVEYEPRNLKTSQLFPITLGFPTNHIVNTVIQVIDKEDMYNYIKNHVKKPLNVFNFFGDEVSEKVQNECDSYSDDVANNDYTPALLSMNVILHERDRQSLFEHEDYLITAFSNMGGVLVPENVENLAKFSINAPGMADYNYDNFTSTTIQSSMYISKESNYLADPKGFQFVDIFGRPINIDIVDSKYIVNRNGIIVAPSGGGKSVLLNNIVSQIMMGEGDVIITDIGHSYIRNNYFEGGKYYDSSSRENFQFNPFLCPQDKKGRYLYRLVDVDKNEEGDDRVNFICALLFLIWKGEEKSTNNEWNVVLDSIEQFYDYVNKNRITPNLIEYEKFIDYYKNKLIKESWERFIDFDSLKLGLYPYVKGNKQYLLNAESNLDIQHDRYVNFDLEAIKKSDIKDFKIISLLISNLVIDKVMQTNRRVYFFNDEVQDFLEDERMGKFIGYLFRTVRKKGGSVFIIGQNINFIKNARREVADSILINCDIKMFLDHSNFKEAYNDLMNYGLLSEDDIEKLDNLVDGVEKGKRFKEFLLKLGNYSWILRNEFSPVVEMIYSTNSDDKQKIERYFEKFGNMSLAVRKSAEEKYNYKN